MNLALVTAILLQARKCSNHLRSKNLMCYTCYTATLATHPMSAPLSRAHPSSASAHPLLHFRNAKSIAAVHLGTSFSYGGGRGARCWPMPPLLLLLHLPYTSLSLALLPTPSE